MQNAMQAFLPNDLINLVDGYFAHSNATEVLVLGTDGKPLDSELNRITIDAIKVALTTKTCDRDIIRLIFTNAVDKGYTPFLNRVMSEVRALGKKILLDDVDFSGINLSKLEFDGASMTNANFTGADLNDASFFSADLSGSSGLSSATGNIAVNQLTVLTGTGIYSESRKSYLVLTTKPFYVSLSNAPEKYGHVKVIYNSTTFLIRYMDDDL